jgi:hypothetical protein
MQTIQPKDLRKEQMADINSMIRAKKMITPSEFKNHLHTKEIVKAINLE